MDAIDRRILELRKQGLGYEKIGLDKNVRMSKSGVKKRIAKLQKEGVPECTEGAPHRTTKDLSPISSMETKGEEKKTSKKRNKQGAPQGNQNAVVHGGYSEIQVVQILEDQGITSESPEWELYRSHIAGELSLQVALATQDEYLKVNALEAVSRNTARAHAIRMKILSLNTSKEQKRTEILVRLQNNEISVRDAALALEANSIEVPRTVLELLRNELNTTVIDEDGGITEEELDRIVAEGQRHRERQKLFLEERSQWLREYFNDQPK